MADFDHGFKLLTVTAGGTIWSGKMNESRMLRRIRAEVWRWPILRVLRTRFQADAPADLASALDGVEDAGRLETLLDQAVTCPDVNAFRDALAAGQTASYVTACTESTDRAAAFRQRPGRRHSEWSIRLAD
jgi:hypothetical protein